MVKKRIVIVLCNDIYIRNYITTDALEEVRKKFDCHFLISSKVTQIERLNDVENVDFYAIDDKLDKRHHSTFNVVMWRYRKLSSAFEFRFRRKFDIPISWNAVRGISAFLRYFAIWSVRRIRIFYIKILGSTFIFPYYKRFIIDRIPVNPRLRDKVLKKNPDLIIYPSSAYNSEGVDLIKIARESLARTLFLIDNWDNLSSKTVMLEKPDFITVWGKQSLEHAIRIHSFEERQVFLMGTPRFDEYFRQRSSKLQSHFDKPYVLYLGCAIPFDEATSLKVLDEEIESNRLVYGELVVVYRPHPWRQGKDSIIGMGLKNVVIDPQVESNYRKSMGVAFQPPLNYYPSLLSNAVFVTGSLTSMVIEALIFYRKVLAIVYDDGKNVTSPHNALKHYPHFKGLSSLDGIVFSDDLTRFGLDFRRMWTGGIKIDTEKLDQQRRYFLYDDDTHYRVRLVGIVDKVLTDQRA